MRNEASYGKPRREFDRKGLTVREVAERTGLSERTVVRWTSRPREEYLLEASARREVIRAMYVGGHSVAEIMEAEGCSRATVYRALQSLPKEFKDKAADTKELLEELLDA